MDRNNVAWTLTEDEPDEKRRGYPAGDFFSAALAVVLKPALTPDERFGHLLTAWAHADLKHKHELQDGLPLLVINTMLGYNEGRLTREAAVANVRGALVALPALLLLALPELAEAIRDYGFRETWKTIA